MLPGEGVGRGYRLHKGFQMGLYAMRFIKKPQGLFLLITTAYRGVAPSGSTGSFCEDNSIILAWATIALALTHPALPIQGRAQGRGATQRPIQTGCHPCLGTSYALHYFWCRLQTCPGTKLQTTPAHICLQGVWQQRRCQVGDVTWVWASSTGLVVCEILRGWHTIALPWQQ